jgi:hypothetical protein
LVQAEAVITAASIRSDRKSLETVMLALIGRLVVSR